MSRRAITLVLLSLFVCPHLAYAKRTAAPKVEPVVYEGVRFTAANDNGRRACVQARDAETARKLWEVTVFRNFIKPWMEECVQSEFSQSWTR